MTFRQKRSIPTMKGEVEAICAISKYQILNRLNSKVTFLKDNPDYNDKGMIGLVISCKG